MDDDVGLLDLGGHFAAVSLMAIGGGVVMLAPDIHRYVVDSHHLITSEQFAAAYTLAQAAPGPNMLYVTLVGWWALGWAGAVVATLAIVVPPTLITATLMGVMARGGRPGRLALAIRGGLAPLSVGLLGAAGWVLLRAVDSSWRGYLLSALALVLAVTTRINPVWLIAGGAVIGLAHWV